MRMTFVQVETFVQAQEMCPWAAHIEPVCGGFAVFESYDDFVTWNRQE